jgi:hypothetical protein
VNLCAFVAGYIQGVLEKITGQPLIVSHIPSQCEQFIAGQNYCEFTIRTDCEKLIRNLDSAKSDYSPEIRRLDFGQDASELHNHEEANK